MARARWVNGNQVAYGASSWYRFVLDVDISGNTITVWWGVETLGSLYDSNNVGDTAVNGAASPFANVNFQHGSGGGVTWIRGEAFAVAPGSSISFSGYVRNLADSSGGGATSSVSASWTNPPRPPNQMAAPTVTNIGSTTHTVNWTAPGTNGAAITGYSLEWQTAAGAAFKTASASASPFNATGFSPNTEYRVRVSATSAAGSSTPSAWRYFTQGVAAPSAPSALTVTRTSDTSQNLTWTRGSQTAGPYASQEILRREGSGGAWGPYAVIATLSGTATSYVDTTTVANRAYTYQVRATNAAGSTTSPASGTVWTTPGTPTDQTASKDASSNIVVTWGAPTGHSFPAYLKYEVSESTNGGSSWTVLATTGTGALSYTHTSPNAALPHTYRVRAIVQDTGAVGDGLASGYATTNTVQLLSPPNAPTNLANTPAGTVDRAQPVTLTWQHNPVDSSPQTKYTLQHRAAGSGTWTTVGPITSSVSSYTLPANAYPSGTAFEWRVMTWGLHATGSAYSAVATVQISSVPGVSISSPTAGSVIGGTVLTTTWTYSDPDGDAQGAWEAILYSQTGDVLETRSGADTATTTTFAYRLEEAAYSVKVRVRDSRGLWSTPDTKNFTVAYPLPPTAVINHTAWDWKRGTVELYLEVPAPSGGQVAPEYLEIWRSIDDGPLQRLVTNLPPATLSYLDFTPTVSGKNTYVVQAVSDLPSASQSAPEDVVTPQAGDGRPAVWLSGGPSFTKVGRLATEVSVSAARLRERVLQKYAGRTLPVPHSGEHVEETWDVSGLLNLRWSRDVDAPSSPEDWLALGALEGTFLLRAPDLFGGGTIYAFVSVDGPRVSRRNGGNVYEVSFSAERVEGSL